MSSIDGGGGLNPEQDSQSFGGLNLVDRFDPERISALAQEFVEADPEVAGVGADSSLLELANGRQFAVAYLDADSPYAEIPRSVETRVFADWFYKDLGPEDGMRQVLEEYGKYDPASVFVSVLDVSDPGSIRSASALRIIKHSDLGFKDVNDLVESPLSPWLDEIKDEYFDPEEEYDPAVAWHRLGKRAVGSEIVLADSLDIASHASEQTYASTNGDLNGPSMLFYHACVRWAQAHGKENLLAIFDKKPFANLQQFGEPFDTYEGLNWHPYGGPGDTLPAFCIIEKGIKKIRQHNEFVAQVFIDGSGLDKHALLPDEYLPDLYSNESVGLPT